MTKKSLSYLSRITYCKNPLAKQLLQLLDDKKTNLALSADVTSCAELLELVEELGSEICILKTHIDILEDFTPAFLGKLKHLAQEKQFLIFEDRKFADIGNTVKLQYSGGIYRISEWADIVNAHSVPGPGIIQGLAKVGMPLGRGLLMLAEMSSVNNLMDAIYARKTLEMAEELPDFVMGFIAQQKLNDDSRWIYMTPGVQFAVSNDELGQQYITPQKAIAENGSDIIIVGRGILQAKDRLAMAKKYREAGWAAYLDR